MQRERDKLTDTDYWFGLVVNLCTKEVSLAYDEDGEYLRIDQHEVEEST